MAQALTWDVYFMRLAREVATRSKCVSRQIGAVLVRDHSIIASGYNGPPRGSALCHDGVCVWPREKRVFRTDLSGCPAAHAEANCLYAAARIGAATVGATLYCACGVPCKACMVGLINAGVAGIVCLPTTSGVGLFYDDLSKRFVDAGLVTVRILDEQTGESSLIGGVHG